MTLQVQFCSWPILSLSGLKVGHLAGLWVRSPSSVDWRQGFLAFISSRFWTKARWNFLWCYFSTAGCQNDKAIQYSWVQEV